jgi:hypothetical protein
MRSVVAASVLAVTLATPLSGQAPAQLAHSSQNELRAFLETQARTPEDYVISKFATHDVVLIGEPHWVRQHVEFVSGMIPRLYRNGIRTLAIEFARRVDQPLIDSLLAQPVYDEQLARRLMLQFLVSWGYQEYVDLYRSAWELNHSLPPDARRFRILALNGAPTWSIIKTEAEFDDWRIRFAAVHGQTEKDWAQVLIDSVLAKGEKALVYTGTHHAFTKYAQPIVGNGKLLRTENERFGQYLYQYAPQRIFMISLHHPWPGPANYDAPRVLPANGMIDDALSGMKQQRVGFDLIGTPFGALVSDSTVYRYGHEPFTLDKFADGYIALGPISAMEPVHPIADFINAANLDYARQNTSHPSERNRSAEEFNADIASALQYVEGWRKIGPRRR